MKLSGTVIWYNPTPQDIYNIKSYIDDVDKLYIIDNSDLYIKNDEILTNRNIEYIHMGGNIGIAKALNVAAKRAIKDGYSYLLTMDQDSKFKKNGIKKLVSFIEDNDMSYIGIVSPWHNTKLKDEKPSKVIDNPLDVMTSGNIINLNIYKEIGGFKDFLFIDGVDIEYCLNLKSKNYKIVRINTVELEHSLGDIFYRKFLWKEFMCDNHNYIRIYYMMRNYRYIRKEYRNIAPEFCDRLVKIKGLLFKIIFYEKDKLRKLRSIFLGIYDYKRKKYGKYEW